MKKNKAIKQKFLKDAEKEKTLEDVLKFSQKRYKRFDEVITLLYNNEDLSSYFKDTRIAKIHQCFENWSSSNSGKNREYLKNVLVYLVKNSSLMSNADCIEAVFNMAGYHKQWEKDIFQWQPKEKSANLQAKELAHYLFCRYEMPAFFHRAFFDKVIMFRDWFIHLGKGGSMRDLTWMPFSLSKKMAHYFMHAPEKYSIQEALRWAQVKGMGGDDRMADRIAYSWLGNKVYSDEEYWESFIRILINQGVIDFDSLTELIDYVRAKKAANPAFVLKGRTLPSLLRQSDEWHEMATRMKTDCTWKPSGLNGCRMEGKTNVIRLVELTESKMLSEEGKAMRHCVVTYAMQCYQGRTAIFSLRKYRDDQLVERIATVEVNLNLKRVVQAKAKLNWKISDQAMRILEQWASMNNLSVNPYL